MDKKMYSWQMTGTGAEFKLVESVLPELGEDEALIKIAGCGVCHTDLSFWHYGVKTKKELPLTLGHEISGKVIDGPSEWIGKKVIILAVLPCGVCELCKKGRSNMCQN
jgi:6-hydroxycyclohex-1-ene-1-carbonyl-CoA dehydrogenase